MVVYKIQGSHIHGPPEYYNATMFCVIFAVNSVGIGKLSVQIASTSPVVGMRERRQKRDAADVRMRGGDEMEICPSGMKQKLTPLSPRPSPRRPPLWDRPKASPVNSFVPAHSLPFLYQS